MAIYYTNFNKNEITIGTFRQVLPQFIKDKFHYKKLKEPFKFKFRVYSYDMG